MSIPTEHDLFPSLFPSRGTDQRQCYVRDGVTSTFVVPGDWLPDREEHWVGDYDREILGKKQELWGNDVEFFVTGEDAFQAIWKDVQDTLNAPKESFVCHAGAWCWLETKGFGGGNYLDMMETLAQRGVLTTALYWSGSKLADGKNYPATRAACRGLNDLNPQDVMQMAAPGSTAVVMAELDDETRRFGCHHQKIWVILGPQGLTAYFGGMDVHPNRIADDTDEDDQHPLHDVHARVRGPAAERLLGIFLWRLIAAGDWEGLTMPAPEKTSDTLPSELTAPTTDGLAEALRRMVLYQRTRAIYHRWERYKERKDAQRRSTSVRVKIGQTIGNPQLEKKPAGFETHEIHNMVERGIRRATRFIYIEDQYFWHIPMAKLLGSRIQDGGIKQLIIVTNLSKGLAEHPERTELALQHLAYAAAGRTDKILVFERVGAHGRYVHAKMFVFDDVSALVGSANFNQRGYGHDSECSGMWVDRVSSHTPWNLVGCTLARKLRATLWAKHLNVHTRHLFDGLGASSLWYEVAARKYASAGDRLASVKEVAPPVRDKFDAVIKRVPWSKWAPDQGESKPIGLRYDPKDQNLDVRDNVERSDGIIDPEP
jgi:phosphatidylserine/phosphatidylglycerophosphate/cardiolipin synthase-like enzyme